MKLAAARLDALPVLGRDFLRPLDTAAQSLAPRFPDVAPDELREAWHVIVARVRLVPHHHNSRAELSVREDMSLVLKKLQGRRCALFEDLFETHRGVAMVVTFIALLELAREHLLEVTQAEAFAPIYVRLAYTPS